MKRTRIGYIIGVGAATTELAPSTGTGVEMRLWLRRLRIFDSLKNPMAIYDDSLRRKRKCCEIRRGWDGRH